jgi:uncharacterized repeat protein (TIGR03803 family)
MSLGARRLLAVVTASASFLSLLRAAPVYEPVSFFEEAPDNPSRGRLLLHTDGNFYGAAIQGGAQDFGTIYRVTPAGALTVVVHFNGTSGAAKGRNPRCRLISDGAGFLWGTTQLGGNSNEGTVFKLNPTTGALTTVVEFTGVAGTAKGSNPQAGLVSDGAGNFWGTTRLGGASNRGTVFRINATTGTLTTLVEFTGVAGVAKGSNPQAALVNDGAGSLWGTTQLGGTPNTGTIFKVNATTGALMNVLDFPSTGSTPRSPLSELVSDGAGNFWGTSPLGGASNFGTVYRVNAATGALTTVVQFTGDSGAALGRGAICELVNDGAGNFWGTAPNGGSSNVGTVFKVRIATGVLSTVVSFTGNFGAVLGENPQAGLTRDTAGNFWGTTLNSGASPGGSVFRVNIASGALTTVVRFQEGLSNSRGNAPTGTLVSDAAGSLWGATSSGSGTGGGTVYKLNPANAALTTVLVFAIASSDNSRPTGSLVNDGAGSFWGTTSQAGLSLLGSVFKVNATTAALSTPVLFTGTGGSARGALPLAGLANDGLGFLWGTASDGGTGNNGTVFKVNIATGALTIVADFTGNTGAALGDNPACQLLNDGAGNMWGTTRQGGVNNAGTVFRINRATGAFTTVVQFTGTSGAARGSSPWAGLSSDGAGNVWGTTNQGGASGFGTVFKINRLSGVLTTVIEFTGLTGAIRGSNPRSSLTLDGAGNFWGMTNAGGTADLGTVFRVSLSGAFTSAFSFTGVSGAVPGQTPSFHGLLYHTDGNLYGTVPAGGFGGGGLVFRVRLDPTPPTGGGLSVSPGVVAPGATVQLMASGWTDANLPLSYQFFLDDVPLGPAGTANTTTFAAPSAPGTHSVKVRVADRLGAFTDALGSFLVNVPPAGGSFVVSPTVAAPGAIVQLSASGWTDPQTPLTYQFFLDTTPLAPAGTSSTASFTAPLALGTYPVKVRIADALGAFTEAAASLVVNNPPVTRVATLGAQGGSTAEIAVAKLLRYSTDPDGEAMQIIAVSPTSAQGGAVALLNGVIYYTAPAGYSGPDSFTYTVRDAIGSLATGTVNVTVAAASAAALNVVSITQTAAGFLVRFAGIPGVSYQIQYRDALTDAWQLLTPPGAIVAGANGIFEHEDKPNPKPASRFYRAVAP